jgi:EmrB/QacA subfamily drug resistance transporter
MVEPIVPNRRLVMLIICMGAFMAALDSTMVVVSLPQMAVYFRCSLAQISWVMIAFLIVSASLLLSCGQLGDLLSPGRLFLLGVAEFTLASVFCGLSRGWLFLVITRCLQGVGAALILGARSKIIAQVYEPGERGLPLGLVNTAMAVAVILGAPLGGWLTSHFGWRYIFFINVPLCVLALGLGVRTLGGLKADSCSDSENCNLRSGLILAACVGVLFLSMDWLRDRGGASGYTLLTLGLAVGLFGLLLHCDRRTRAPLLHPDLWRRKSFRYGSLGVVPAAVAFQGTFFILPFFMEHVYRLPPHHSGLLLIPLALTSSVAAPLSGYLSDRWGNMLILRGGAAFLAMGVTALLFTTSGDSFLKLGIIFGLIGMGYGLFHTPNLNEVLERMEPALAGLAASSVSLLKKFGANFGITLIVGVFAWEHQHDICLGPGVCLEIEYFHLAFSAMAALAVVNFFIHLFRKA